VKIINSSAMKHSTANDNAGRLIFIGRFLRNRNVSVRYAAAAAIKKIKILNQSGDLLNAPL